MTMLPAGRGEEVCQSLGEMELDVGRYRKIDTRIWNDSKFVSLSDNGKLAFMFLLTHPHLTSLGAMRATIPGLAAELGWELADFTVAFASLVSRGLVEHDPRAAFVGLPNFLKYNTPESPNVVRSWATADELIPECELKTQLLKRVTESVESLGEGFRKAFREVFGKSMPNPEPVTVTGTVNTGKGPVPSGAFKSVTTETLEDTSKLMAWHDSAAARKRPLVADTASDRLFVVGAAVRALELGDNPPAFFASIIADRSLNKNITGAQEDIARNRLKAWQARAGPPTSTAASVAASLQAPTE